MKTPTLETDRLTLRPVSIDDAPAIQKHFNNWNIIKHLSMVVPWPYPDDGAEAFLRDVSLPEMAAGKAHTWGVLIKGEPDEIVGLVEYTEGKASGGNRGFWLAEEFWGNGYMSEAITGVQDFLFFKLGIESMIVVNAKTNARSRRVKEKTGARFIGDGTLEHRSGENEVEKWEVTRESWAKFRNKGIQP